VQVATAREVFIFHVKHLGKGVNPGAPPEVIAQALKPLNPLFAAHWLHKCAVGAAGDVAKLKEYNPECKYECALALTLCTLQHACLFVARHVASCSPCSPRTILACSSVGRYACLHMHAITMAVSTWAGCVKWLCMIAVAVRGPAVRAPRQCSAGCVLTHMHRLLTVAPAAC
jgi:hypothetical protein